VHIRTPSPQPRKDGDYKTYVSIGYGDPYGIIHLAEGDALDLDDVRVEDCDRLIRAAAEVKEKLLRYHARAAAPHGRNNLYQGTCQLCGKPEGDTLHAEQPLAVTEARISVDPETAAEFGVKPLAVEDGEPLPDCARPGCGHPRFHHWEFGPTTPSSPASGCDLTGCPCPGYAATFAAVASEIRELRAAR
jgi:hypothetical protein